MDAIDQLAETLKALSDPTRLKLVQLLSQNAPHGDACDTHTCNGHGFLCVNALAHRLGVTQSAVSQHLRVLRQAGLVRHERRGHFAHYTLNRKALDGVQSALQNALSSDPPAT